MNNPNILPMNRALLWIFLSALCTLVVFGGGLWSWNYFQVERASDPRYNIVAIVQSCKSSEPLKTNFLAQLMGLSIDYPTNLYQFDAAKSQLKLQNYPIIKFAQVKKIRPSMIFVEYALRKPVAYLAEYTNALIDDEGIIIPARPFYTPKKAYELVLGLPKSLEWGTKVSEKKLHLVQTLIDKISELDSNEILVVKRIDVAQAFSKKCGDREIVVFLEDSINSSASRPFMSVLRLSPNSWEEQLPNYRALRFELAKQGSNNPSHKMPHYIVDMRISQLAFIAKAS
jgi:hypothetical protein